MGRRRRKHKHGGPFTTEIILEMLQYRAGQRAKERGHDMQVWCSSKKAHGKASQMNKCRKCGKAAVIMPYGPVQGGGRPTIRGDAAFLQCQ